MDTGFWVLCELKYGGVQKIWITDDADLMDFENSPNVLWAHKVD